MFTPTEKKYLILTLAFLATGSGLKAYHHAHIQIGPMEDSRLHAADSTQDRMRMDSSAFRDTATHLDMAAGSRTSTVENSVRDSSNLFHPFTGSAAGPDLRQRPKSPHAASGHKADFAGKVSLNHAGPGELTAIRGVGDKTARAILQYRQEHGPFRELRDLLLVKGIGEKKLEKIVPFLIL